MKPINAKELNRSYVLFSVNFIVLATFSIFCLYLFFAAQSYEYNLLRDEANQAEQLLSKRKDVNNQFDLILSRFNELSKFSSINAEEMDNQASMLEDIQNANFKIKDILKQQQSDMSSFKLYKKMTDDVTQMSGIQDSLFNTRFQLESIKTQLGSCLKVNHSAENKLSFGTFRR
jgi:DNA repair ATPase RecN